MEEAINSKIIQKNQIPSQENIISNEIESNKTPKPKFQDQRSLSPSKIIKKNSFKIVPIELFEEELDNYMNQYLQNLPNNYSESFLSKADQILKEEKICEKNILEIYYSNDNMDTIQGLAILFVDKVLFNPNNFLKFM